MNSIINRYESTPIPSLPNYAFGERLGGGSYGKDFHQYSIYVFPLLMFRNCI